MLYWSISSSNLVEVFTSSSACKYGFPGIHSRLQLSGSYVNTQGLDSTHGFKTVVVNLDRWIRQQRFSPSRCAAFD